MWALRVYKYLCTEFALRTLVEHRMKISVFSDMNDPFELAVVAMSNPKVHDNLIGLIKEENWGALCLSKDWNNPLLWSHYGDRHKGVCLGFETGANVEVLSLNYVETVQEVSTDCFERLAETRHLPGAQTPETRRKAVEPLIRVLSTKFKKWEYENEARLLASMEVEEAGLWFHPFDDDFKLCEVIAGARCPLGRATIEDAVKGYGYPIRIFKVRLAERAFEVVEDPNGFAS